jgi:hypothetical protein
MEDGFREAARAYYELRMFDSFLSELRRTHDQKVCVLNHQLNDLIKQHFDNITAARQKLDANKALVKKFGVAKIRDWWYSHDEADADFETDEEDEPVEKV